MSSRSFLYVRHLYPTEKTIETFGWTNSSVLQWLSWISLWIRRWHMHGLVMGTWLGDPEWRVLLQGFDADAQRRPKLTSALNGRFSKFHIPTEFKASYLENTIPFKCVLSYKWKYILLLQQVLHVWAQKAIARTVFLSRYECLADKRKHVQTASRHSSAANASMQPTQTSEVAQSLFSRESEVPDAKILNGTVDAPQSKH